MKARFDELSAACSKATTQLYSTSFSLGIRLLSRPMRAPIYAIYGFVRLADEIVDSFHDHDKAYLLAKFKSDCYEAIAMGISLNPVLNAFQQVVNTYGIDHELIDLFMKSMEMDLEQLTYTPESYEDYILGSAQVVGLMCLQVFTEGDKTAYEQLKRSAMMLGSAFQKVNFLRDANADYRDLDRTYFPGVDLDAFSDRDKRAIEEEIDREFSDALAGIRRLPRNCRKGVYLAYIYYQKLFQKIKRISARHVLSERIRISNGHKCWLMVDSMVRYKLNVL
ncbi:phytoene/squalene synthase family protein [Mucilaginibacter myungsuensis]|uniref:Phytoene/squalene synthase family protein n=1 Tax=Mucilaginibacter myungsuensis TaxID=649104 RepID=A0A929L489_9SPHI|nr:phytoene/squalene synthase family protein [Mucilaginibacter myungsuensis]MBE9662941.1 phytoene/squalene synthase family protein [Mucilaginibacter myungsuensis]MDN3598562.1 phytoene/squalene synthase family protein [Mucilaginibacter myungsuensis]